MRLRTLPSVATWHVLTLAFLMSLTVTVWMAPLASAQSPLFETRGVWFATVLEDGNWPESPLDSPAKKTNDLRKRIRDAKSLGLNTFVFQAVARGDAMYPSFRLPWSVRLTGASENPGFNPLAVAIDEAHRLGMELHVWINTHRVGDVSTVPVFEGLSNPGHVYYQQPGWVGTRNGQLWLDPSSAAGRSWLVGNVMEIVDGYDLDAVHFDFIRYPEGGLADDLPNFQFDPRGFDDIDDWRRDNITEFVRDVSQQIYSVKPWVKIGSAPFGNYENFDGAWPAAWALSSVFQESRKWLADGIHDYLSPQLYFDIGREPEPNKSFDSPDFEFLVQDWVDHSSNRPIFVGHGPYKAIVLEELDTQIALTRTLGSAGQFFFRYDHIEAFDFQSSYPTQALPAPMPHRFEAAAPSIPTSLGAVVTTDDFGDPIVRLTWEGSSASLDDPLRGYAVFRATGRDPVVTDGADLADFVWSDVGEYVDRISSESPDYRYSVRSVSRLGFASAKSEVVRATPVSTESLAGPTTARILSIFPNPATSQIVVSFAVDVPGHVLFRVIDLLGRPVWRREQFLTPGTHRTTIDIGHLSSNLYHLSLDFDEVHAVAPFVVAR